MIIKSFTAPTETLDSFKRLCELTVKYNGTHVLVSRIPKNMWLWDIDSGDPYPAWHMQHISFFKIITPEALKPWIPQDWAAANAEIIAKRGEILREYGLKAVFSGCEPAYVNSDVFRVFPEWRGAQCEKPRLAKKGYFSLCIDNEDVLEMYRNSVRELCKLAPIESFSFLSNDSGAGVCWTDSLYCGVNGNPDCKGIIKGKRFEKFMSTIQQGAMDAGGSKPFVSMGGSIEPQEAAGIKPYLSEKQSICGLTNDTGIRHASMGIALRFFGSNFYPGKLIPEPLDFIKGYGNAINNDANDVSVAFDSVDENEDFSIRLYDKCVRSKAPKNAKEAEDLLYDFAKDEVGNDLAPNLYDAYQAIANVKTRIEAIVTGPVFLISTVGDRWLIRPLVARELELPDEDRMYFRKYQFHALSEEEAADLAHVHTWRFFGGNGAMFISTNLFKRSIEYIKSAIANTSKIRDNLSDAKKKAEYDILTKRLEVQVCIFQNAINVIKFQEILDRTDFDTPPVEHPIKFENGDQKWHEIHLILQSEIANTTHLIKLLKSTDVSLITTASKPEEEDPLWLSPNIIPQLEKKNDITMRHYEDFNKYYVKNS